MPMQAGRRRDDPAVVCEAIEGWEPTGVRRELWEPVIDVIRAQVRWAEPRTVQSARGLCRSLLLLLLWAQVQGFPIELKTLFRPQTVRPVRSRRSVTGEEVRRDPYS